MELRWCDEYLQWNSSEQACVKRNRSKMSFTPDEIWTPDIIAVNGPGQLNKPLKLQYPIIAACTGNIHWSYQEKVMAFCAINVVNFPFDRQNCSIIFQSTIYDSSQLRLVSLYNVVRLYDYITTEWQISHATIEENTRFNPNHQRDFSTLQIDIELVRFSRFYILKIIVPFCIISSLAVFSFCLPTDSGERVALAVSVLLSLTFYLQLISDHVPKTDQGVCTLTLYSNGIFLLVFLSCIFNIFTVFIYYHEQYSQKRDVPKRKKSILFTVHQSLVELNKKRWAFLRKRQNLREHLPEQTDITAIELLHDIRYFRQSLMNMFIRRNSVITSTTFTLSAFDFRHPFFYPKSKAKQSVKRIAILIDRILFVIYLISLPLSILFLYQSTHQSYQASLARTNKTNQLHDLRKATSEPIVLYQGCSM